MKAGSPGGAIRSVCPLNCPDTCDFLVRRDGDSLHLDGDTSLSGYDAFLCTKGRDYAALVHSPQRPLQPLRKRGKLWQRLSWEDAFSLLAEKITAALAKGGPHAILHFFGTGYSGALGVLDQRFFQALGGVTVPSGSMCWQNGVLAQLQDFGELRLSTPASLAQAKTILIWGRDPAITNKHLVPQLLEAQKKGAHIVVLNPLRVKSSVFADEYIRVNPATDGVLALGLAHFILTERRMEFEYAREHLAFFPGYADLVKTFPPARVAAITGVAPEVQRQLALRLTEAKPALFLLGYGLQRYLNGVETIRAIDALAAISSNVGLPGGGVFYAHTSHSPLWERLLPERATCTERSIPYADLAKVLPQTEPRIDLAVVTRSNPHLSLPDTRAWLDFWHSVPFKVTLDIRLSETAADSDLVLPLTTIFERQDLVFTAQNPYIRLAQQVLPPQGEVRSEVEIFTALAQRLGKSAYFPYDEAGWLDYVLAPLGIDRASLAAGPLTAPYIAETSWLNQDFQTPSAKIELITKSEFLAGSVSPVAHRYSGETSETCPPSPTSFPTSPASPPGALILLTPHPDLALGSQFQSPGLTLFLHPHTAQKHDVSGGEIILVESNNAALRARVETSDDIHPDIAVLGYGITEMGEGVNMLTEAQASPLAANTAYYDNFCLLKKVVDQ